MSRQPDPERIRAARREASLRLLIRTGELPDRAEQWVAAWEAEAGRFGPEQDGAYWEAGWAWIAEHRTLP